MDSYIKTQVSREEVKDRLVNFAVNPDDLKGFLTLLPAAEEIDLIAVEYEARILKIISVGWGISFFLSDCIWKNELAEAFWQAINDFSVNLSLASSSVSGKEIDYFSILKERLDHYVAALSASKDAVEPLSVIAPEFAGFCGAGNNAHVIMLGNRIFSSAVGGVKEYILSVEIQNGKNG